MHLNTGEIKRPSLLSADAQTTAQAPNSGRILADMEGRATPASPRAPTIRAGSSRRTWWMLIAGGLISVCAVLAWIIASESTHDDADEYSFAPASEHIENPLAHTALESDGAAMIVDAESPKPADKISATAPVAAALLAPAAAPTAPLPAAQAIPAVLAKPAPAVEKKPATKPTRAARPDRAAARATAARRPTTAARRSNPPKEAEGKTLIGTLLGIIKEEEQAKASTPSPNNMDDLIAKIEAGQQQRSSDEGAVFQRVSSRKSASTDSGIQAQLRRCPNANTLQGIECRRQICSNVTRQDPACPAL